MPARTPFPTRHRNMQLVQEIGRQATLITGEPGESTFLLQPLLIALGEETINRNEFLQYDIYNDIIHVAKPCMCDRSP